MSRDEYVVDTFRRDGYKADLIIDMDCSSPRENDGNFLFLSFRSRDTIAADEEIGRSRPCPACEGAGYVADPVEGEDIECAACGGIGDIEDRMDLWIESLKAEYDANLVLPVGYDSHGPNCRYFINDWSDEIDGTIYGFILDTPATLEERMGPGWEVDIAVLREGMEAEIDEYSKWADGECFGYVITDRNGDDVDSCWGFIGREYAEAEVLRELEGRPPQPPKLHTVQLTAMEIDSILAHLAPDSTDVVIQSIASKLEAIDTDEEDE